MAARSLSMKWKDHCLMIRKIEHDSKNITPIHRLDGRDDR
jgi:hypothetical protein